MSATLAQAVTAVTNAGTSQTARELAALLGIKQSEAGVLGDSGVRAGSLVRLSFGYPLPVKYGLPGAAS